MFFFVLNAKISLLLFFFLKWWLNCRWIYLESVCVSVYLRLWIDRRWFLILVKLGVLALFWLLALLTNDESDDCEAELCEAATDWATATNDWGVMPYESYGMPFWKNDWPKPYKWPQYFDSSIVSSKYIFPNKNIH